MDQTVAGEQLIFNYDRWYAHMDEAKAAYRTASPYPHIVFENFLEVPAAESARSEFPAVKSDGWIHYVHVNEKKHGLNKMDQLPPFPGKVIRELNSDRFVKFLEELTGIEGLIADDMLEGGGLHQTEKGGFLNIHADFTVHPHKRNWRRRVNILIYLNKDWEEAYGGHLELWSRDMKRCEHRILPVFNRCVIFNTDEDSWHGQPEPLQCPEGQSRKSIALYYFTEEKVKPRKRTTNYQARPQDGARSILIWLDKSLVSTYSRVKSALGLSDDFASKLLNIFNRKK